MEDRGRRLVWKIGELFRANCPWKISHEKIKNGGTQNLANKSLVEAAGWSVEAKG